MEAMRSVGPSGPSKKKRPTEKKRLDQGTPNIHKRAQEIRGAWVRAGGTVRLARIRFGKNRPNRNWEVGSRKPRLKDEASFQAREGAGRAGKRLDIIPLLIGIHNFTRFFLAFPFSGNWPQAHKSKERET